MADFDFSDIFEDSAGVNATYTPADSQVEPFAVRVIPTGGTSLAQFQPFGYADETAVFIQHSELEAGGVSAPATRDNGQDGDLITFDGPAGIPETWWITKRDYYHNVKLWACSIEKDVRFRA